MEIDKNMETRLPKELQSTAVIRFQDCDPFQHLNNARYLDYFLNARDDQLRQYYDFSIFGHTNETKQGWVVSKTQIAYVFPAALMEEVVIKTRLIHMSETTITIEGIMLDKEQKRPKAFVWMEFTYISIVTGRTINHSDDLTQFFRSVVDGDSYQPDGFNQRVEQVKREFRKRPVESPIGVAVS
jgi:YbgC/YbaW family acyl-CoA thioester hydrolase